MLKTCRAVLRALLGRKSLPTRIKIVEWGAAIPTSRGTVFLDDESLKVFEANQAEFKRQTVQVIAVAGYGRPEIVQGEGIYLRDMKWTTSGEMLSSGHTLSPVPYVANDKIVGIDSCTLTATT